MYKHHEDSLKNLIAYFEGKPGVIALVFGGSVAKGCERPDSDLDAMVVLTDEAYEEKLRTKSTAESISGFCTYPEGYFDIKYFNKQYLMDAAEKGSEPTRNAFVKSRVLFSSDPEIESIVERISTFNEKERDEKLLSFFADFWLNYYYFLKECPIDGYMKVHVTAEIIYSVYRMILQENRVIFPSNRRLEEFVEAISDDTAKLVELGRKYAASQSMEDADAFVKQFYAITTYKPPRDGATILSTYVSDFEQWWRVPRPNINEW